jgi:hypothetical protein
LGESGVVPSSVRSQKVVVAADVVHATIYACTQKNS